MMCVMRFIPRSPWPCSGGSPHIFLSERFTFRTPVEKKDIIKRKNIPTFYWIPEMIQMAPRNRTLYPYLVVVLVMLASIVIAVSFSSKGASGEDTVPCHYKGGFGGSYKDVDFDGEYLYAAHIQGLSIFDVSDPSEPERVGFLHTSGYAQGVAVEGDYAYVADSTNGLIVVDVTDKTNPQRTGGWNTSDVSLDVAVVGEHAYIADGNNGLVVVDITNKSDPQRTGSYNTAGHARDVAVVGDYAYIADDNYGLVIIDITNKSDPQEIGWCDPAGDAFGVAVAGNYAYLAFHRTGLIVVDVTNKRDPKVTGKCEISNYVLGVAVAGNHAYVAHGLDGLAVIDVTDKADPWKVGNFRVTNGWALSVAVAGDHAFIADNNEGLVIVDVIDKANPRRIGNYATSRSGFDVAVLGNYAYIADGGNGLVIVDITDRTAPERTGSYNTQVSAWGVEIVGNYAFIADHANGLVIIDVTDKTKPEALGNYNTGGYALDVIVLGDYAYIANGKNGLVVVNISDKANPMKVGDLDTLGFARAVAVLDDYVYLADSEEGLVVIDTSDKTNPTIVGGYESEDALDVVVIEGHAYLGDGDNGLVILNIADRTEPQRVGGYDTAGQAWGIAVAGDHVCIADRSEGLVLVNVTDRSDPKKVGGYDTGNARNVVIDDYIYVADEASGLVILDAGLPYERPKCVIDAISPDPALYTERIQFAGDSIGDSSITAYNWHSSINGELSTEASFETAELDPGIHTVSFMVRNYLWIWSEPATTTLTVQQHPVVESFTVTLVPAVVGANVQFTPINITDDGLIVLYRWASDLDGVLNETEDSNFYTASLSLGEHEITLTVKDNHGLWSEPFTRTILIHEKPNASIDSISPNPVIQGDEINFSGDGDDDGSVELYRWTSSLDGELYEGNSSSFSTTNLSIGNHTITLLVQDNHGAWSEPVTITLEVKEYVPPGNILPTVTIESPKDGAELKDTVTIKGSASDADGTVEKVDISVDGEWFTATGITSWEFELDTTKLDNGQYVLKVLAYDGEDYSNDTLLSITVNNEKKDDGGDAGFLPGFGLLGLVLGLILVGIVRKHRKRTR